MIRVVYFMISPLTRRSAGDIPAVRDTWDRMCLWDNTMDGHRAVFLGSQWGLKEMNVGPLRFFFIHFTNWFEEDICIHGPRLFHIWIMQVNQLPIGFSPDTAITGTLPKPERIKFTYKLHRVTKGLLKVKTLNYVS